MKTHTPVKHFHYFAWLLLGVKPRFSSFRFMVTSDESRFQDRAFSVFYSKRATDPTGRNGVELRVGERSQS